jgi:hypothetical protein
MGSNPDFNLRQSVGDEEFERITDQTGQQLAPLVIDDEEMQPIHKSIEPKVNHTSQMLRRERDEFLEKFSRR